ncbi:MAG: diacylglycerol kinase family protein, partial [Chloroflexota bacterium]
MKAVVIFNPHAHSGETSQRISAGHADILQHLQQALHLDTVDWLETEHPGHATSLAADATTAGYDMIFAGGGDGTINEVLNGLMSHAPNKAHRPIFGVLPFGTSNDFFVALKAAEAAQKTSNAKQQTMPLDVGQVVFDDLKRYFCLTTSLGLLSWANEQYLDASRRFGRRFAHIPAAIATILSYRFLPNVRISENGKRFHGRRILALTISNSPVIAGGVPLTPEAKVNDGYLDVCIIKPVSLPRLIWLALQITRKAHTHSKSVILERITEMTVIAKQPLPIHMDGELIPELESKASRM